jgi:hypothetical protein
VSDWKSRCWGQMYLVPVDWDPEAEDADDRVVYSFEYGRSHFKVASELWGLADDPERADKIESIFSAAYQRKPRLIEKADVELLRQLLAGIEDRLVGTFTDEHWNVPTDRIPELRRRTTMLEIDDAPHAIPEAAIAAGLSRVAIAREILDKAVNENLNVILD